MSDLIIQEAKRTIRVIKFLQDKVTQYGTLLSGLIEKHDVTNEELDKILKDAIIEKENMIKECGK
ncbi:MAG: hypothetical protein FVQ78_09995 [Solirubrobacterales bacterium]|nr:hypothetical protein [Solirubrobacterales bacterium]